MSDAQQDSSEKPTPTESSTGPLLERGKVYASAGPSGEQIAIMTFETWEDFGTNVESLRQFAARQTRELEEAKSQNSSLVLVAADANRRLDNLRAVRRAEKRPEVEKQVNAMIGENDV